MYIGIIGDVVKSRGLNNRREVQKDLMAVLAEINAKYKNDIESQFTITIGDEFQGLLKNPNPLVSILEMIKLSLYPVTFRFGIGIGELSTDIQPYAIGSDGPAYYNAREAITLIKSRNQQYEQPESDTLLSADTEKESIQMMVGLANVLFTNCYFSSQKWSDKQRDIIKELAKEDITQRALAELNQVTQSSVQRRISKSGYYTYKYNLDTVHELLKHIWGLLNES